MGSRGGVGADVMTGGAGADTFVFAHGLVGLEATITDFVQGVEDLQYSVGGAMNNLASAAMMFGEGIMP